MERIPKPNSSDGTFLVTTDSNMTVEKMAEYFEQDRATAVLYYKTAEAIITEHDIVKFVASGKDASTTSIESIMTLQPVCVKAAATPVEILNTMKKARFRHVPQVDSSGQVVDIIDIVNIAQQLHQEQQNDNRSNSTWSSWVLDKLFAPETRNTAVNTWSEINLGGDSANANDFTQGENLGISKITTVEDAAKEMLKRKTSGLLVVDRETGELEGIFCESDIVRKVVSRGLSPSKTQVRAAMTIKPTTLNTEATKPLDALNMMLEKRFRHLPVADNNNRATGLYSILNLTFDVLGSQYTDEYGCNKSGNDMKIISRGLHTYNKLVEKWEKEFANVSEDFEEDGTLDTNDCKGVTSASREATTVSVAASNNTDTVNIISSNTKDNIKANEKFNEKMMIALRKRNDAVQYLNKSECQQARKSFGRCILHFKQAERHITNDKNRFIMDKAKADIYFRLGETNFLMAEYSDALSDYEQVEALACCNNRSFDDESAMQWMIKDVGLHPNHLFTSKIQALCQLLRYEDAVRVLCIVKNNNELCKHLLRTVITPVVNQHTDNGFDSLEKK